MSHSLTRHPVLRTSLVIVVTIVSQHETRLYICYVHTQLQSARLENIQYTPLSIFACHMNDGQQEGIRRASESSSS